MFIVQASALEQEGEAFSQHSRLLSEHSILVLLKGFKLSVVTVFCFQPVFPLHEVSIWLCTGIVQ